MNINYTDEQKKIYAHLLTSLTPLDLMDYVWTKLNERDKQVLLDQIKGAECKYELDYLKIYEQSIDTCNTDENVWS